MSMPRRDPNHITGDKAFQKFEQLFEHWVVRPPVGNDYGVDCEVEIFDNDSYATGLTFKAQMKGSRKKLGGKAPKVQVKTSTLNYWRSLDVPVLVCYYSIESGDAYARWAHSYDPVVSKSGKSKKSKIEPKNTTFTFTTAHRVPTNFLEKVLNEVVAVRTLRQRVQAGPIPFRLSFGTTLKDVNTFELERAFQLSLDAVRHILRLDDTEDASICGSIHFERKKFRLAMPVELASLTVHTEITERLASDERRGGLIADTMVAAATLFSMMGLCRQAVELTDSFQLNSSLPVDAEIAGGLASSFFEQGNVDGAVALLIVPLVSPDAIDREAAEWLLHPIFHFHIQRLSERGINVFIYGLEHRIRIENEEGRPAEAARFAYLKAQVQKNARPPRFDDSLLSFREAESLDAGYASRGYFHHEVGAVLADSDNWFSALDEYRTALSRPDHPDGLHFFLVDTLLHCGRYYEALEHAREESLDLEPHASKLKLWALSLEWITSICNEQERHQLTEAGLSALRPEMESEQLMRVLASTDVLDANVLSLLLNSLEDDAFTALGVSLTAAISTLANAGPWLLAAHLLLVLDYPTKLAETCIDQILRFAPDDLHEATRGMEDLIAEDDYSALQQLVRRRAKRGRPEAPKTSRVIYPDGSWETVRLDL